MCGICGYWDFSTGGTGIAPREVLERMAGSLSHRGPDDAGTWWDDGAGIGFGHRRLSIVDLSPSGHQPMTSADGRLVIAFNGEIYNFTAIRAELDALGHAGWRGHSDTEVLLAAVSRWGLETALSKFNGMFAFALWDREARTLTLARDRLGEKPLYYGWSGGALLFGSELKALRAHPRWSGAVDREVLALYLRHGYVPAPHSIYGNVRKIPPGTWVTFGAGRTEEWPQPRSYWSARSLAESAMQRPTLRSDADAVDGLQSILSDAVAMRMVADVPLGAFLSGGIDSSTIVALMQQISPRPVNTFSIGFREKAFDEAGHARAVARHLGTAHEELYVAPREAMAVIPALAAMYDEPFADSSQIPTYLVSSLARRSVTVALSGDGGDELFGGYNRYRWAVNIWNSIRWLPAGVRRAFATALMAAGPRGGRWLQTTGSALTARSFPALVTDKLPKLAEVMRVSGPEEAYMRLVSLIADPRALVLGAAREAPSIVGDRAQWAEVQDFRNRMMYLDAVTYLPDDILVKIDRASMKVGLEGRVPLLDHRVVEYAWSVPLSQKIRRGETKWLLRQLLYRFVPKALVDRPKMGFGVPIDSWLRGPLREWAEGLLDAGRLRREGYFDVDAVRRKWDEHQSGARDWQYTLWVFLMFQAWLYHEHAPSA